MVSREVVNTKFISRSTIGRVDNDRDNRNITQ